METTTAPSRLQRTGDRVGMWASLLCAVHCALLPLALAALPALGLTAFDVIDIDGALAIVATLLGIAMMLLGYRRHRSRWGWALLIPGLILIWLNTFTHLHDHSISHAVMMCLGGLMIASAHFLNVRLGQSCHDRHCDAHPDVGHG